MFDIGWQELFLIIIVAVVVLGPKDLPYAIRTVTGAIRKMRVLAGEFQRGIDDVVREAELEEIRGDIQRVSNLDLTKEIEKTIDPGGTVAREIDMSDLQTDLDETARIASAPPPAVPATERPADDAKPALDEPAAPAENEVKQPADHGVNGR